VVTTMDYFRPSIKRMSSLFAGPKTQFQVLSDLHLDHESQYLTFHIPVAAPFLILAGNTGRLIDYDNYLSFMVRRCNLHEKVYLVLGALEFHGLSLTEGLRLAQRMEKEPATKGRLEVLYNTRSDVPETNVTLLGCTLWSRIPDAYAVTIMRKMLEFDEEHGIKGWDVKQHNIEHEKDLVWLIDQVKQDRSTSTPARDAFPGASAAPITPGKPNTLRELVVITSFAPDLKNALEPWEVDTPWAAAYGTDVLTRGSWNDVKMWIYGMTGKSCEFEKSGVTIVSNQRGRSGEEVTGLLEDGMPAKKKIGLFDVTKVVKV
jgi:hypothetical protein